MCPHEVVPYAYLTLKTVSAVYLLYLAWKIATAPVGRIATDGDKAPSFIPALALAVANPKAYAAIGAVYAGHRLIADNLAADTMAKLAALFLVIVVVNTTWLAFGALFARLLTNPVIGRTVNVVFALMLVGSVALALSGEF